jgi:hypothetical protein
MMNTSQTTSNWPERFSDADCLEKKANLPLYTWMGEYMIDPIGLQSRLFTEDMINYYAED